ncbi:HIT domain-containing protein [Thermostilla marina]
MSMDRIWAPWRLAYVQSADERKPAPIPPEKLLPDADPECFLCQAVAAPDDPDRLVVTRDERTIVVLNRFPYNNGHLLIAPCRHVGDPRKLTSDEHAALMDTMTRMLDLLEDILQPHGFNVGANLGRVAGAGLPGHLHWHVVPRWNGDTNFMPVLADTKVIPQSLESLREALRKKL